jgi:hypothetical protein
VVGKYEAIAKGYLERTGKEKLSWVYLDYLVTEACYNLRKDYSAQYIAAGELETAKRVIRAKEIGSGLSKDVRDAAFNDPNLKDAKAGFDKSFQQENMLYTFDVKRQICQAFYHALLKPNMGYEDTLKRNF